MAIPFILLGVLMIFLCGASATLLAQRDTTPPQIERTVPDLSEKVAPELKAIRIVFSEKMQGMDVGFYGVPVGDLRWADDDTTLVVSFRQPLSPSKVYRLILGGDGNITDKAGNPLAEHILTFTTEGPDPVTPTFVDITPVHVIGNEELDFSKELLCPVSEVPAEGFNYPYYLFIPHGVDVNKPLHLLVEPCNSGTTTDNFKSHDQKAKGLAEASHANQIAKKLKVPLLVPVFPRPGGDLWHIYTHALDRDTLLIKDGDLQRIDLQLIKMIAHTQRFLQHNNVKVKKKVFMNGFSASGTFTNRFAILHPRVVRAVATGGVNSIPTFPTDRWKGTPMRYPVGIADVKEIAGLDFDEAAYEKVSQYIYMGAFDDNDTVPYRDAYDEVDAELVKNLIGAKMMPDRWGVSQAIYRELGIPAQFVTYESTGHEIKTEMIEDVVAFFKANSDAEIVEIDPHQYGPERHIVLNANTATESGRHLAEGTVDLRKTDAALTSAGYSTRGMGLDDPSPRYMLLSYLIHYPTDLFRFPLGVGDTWTQEGKWDTQVETTLAGYEQVVVSAGTFPASLKHKTVFADANAGSDLKNSLVNGTRYLWFAKGVGPVKMRYEHANGVVTEAELLEYNVPIKGDEYFPLKVGNQWTYKWQNGYRTEAVIETCCVARELGTSEVFDNPMALKSARYEVAVTADEPRVAKVKCVLTPKVDGGESIGLYMSQFGTEGILNGYGGYLRDLTATDADGVQLPIVELGKTQWAVKVENESPVMLSYKVLLNHDEREWPPGRSEAPYVQEDSIFCPGYALFIVGEVNDIELRVNVPESWYVSTPWHRIGGEKHRFTITDQDDLIYAYMVLGTHSEKVAKSNDAEVVLAIGGSFRAAVDEMQGTVEAFLQAYSRVFGGTPKGRMLFVANPYGEKGEAQGGVSGRSISVLIGGALDKASRHLWVPLVGHEVVHIWNGKAINFREQEYWFSEGFTEYYSNIVSVRLGFTSESDFLKNLERACEAYLSQQGELSIREAGKNKSANNGLVYQGGSLIAAAVDMQIREFTANQKSLDDVMRQMYREFGTTGETYTMEDVIRILSEVADKDFEPFFRKYVSGTERLPLETYLKDAGVDVNIEYGERLPNLRYIVHEMLHIKSIGGPPGGGMFIDNSPQYQDNDRLIGIDGTSVETFDDIRQVAVDWKSGDVVALTLEREGEEIILPVTLGGDTSKGPPLEAGPIDVTITKKVDSTAPQRAILTGILGGHR